LVAQAAANSGDTSIRVYKPNSSDFHFPGYNATAGLNVISIATNSGALGCNTVGTVAEVQWPYVNVRGTALTAINTAGSAAYDTLTLASGLHRSVGAGEYIMAGEDGGTWLYWGNAGNFLTVPGEWTDYGEHYRGLPLPLPRFDINGVHGNAYRRFRHRTAYVQVGFFSYYGSVKGPWMIADCIITKRTVTDTTPKMVLDPSMTHGGGMWHWQVDKTRTESWTPIIKWEDYNGTGADSGRFVLRVGSAYAFTHGVGGRLQQ
jgi:hypothetical protein